VVTQEYATEPSNEYIVLGNDALVKCKIPSYVSDLAQIVGWVDSEASEFLINNHYGNLRVKFV